MTILGLIILVAVILFLAWFIKTNLTGLLQQVLLAILVIAVLIAVLNTFGLLGGLTTRIGR